jgi:hypothetical protein
MNVLAQIDMMGSVLELYGRSQDHIMNSIRLFGYSHQIFLFIQDSPVRYL